MEETKVTKEKAGGFASVVDIPKSNIYISGNKQETKKKFLCQAKEANFHFFLILNSGQNYTQEMITSCDGSIFCFNCNQSIHGQIYFYPTDFNRFGDPSCVPIPHCRAGCALRSCMDAPNNHDLISNFYLMYGNNVVCAPPRVLLYIPGGLSLKKYHEMMDNCMVVQEERKNIRSFLAPVYISCTMLKDHQLVTDVVSLIEELSIESKISIGPSRSRDNSQMNVVELETPDLFKTPICSMFSVDPASYRD